MRYEEFITTVQTHGAFATRARAASAARATLQTLAERLGGDTANALAAELPPELARYVRRSPDDDGEPFPVDEFWSRVAERADLERAEAVRVARAVLDQLAGAVPQERIASVWARIPEDLRSQLDRRAGAPARARRPHPPLA